MNEMKKITDISILIVFLSLVSCTSDQRHDFNNEPVSSIVVPASFDMRVNQSSVSDLSITLDGGGMGEITISSSWRNRDDVEKALNILRTEILPASDLDLSDPYNYVSPISGEEWLVQVGQHNDYSKAQFLYVSEDLWTWVNFDLNFPSNIDWEKIIDSISH